VRPDLKVLTDLTIFARAELASGDIEPWAAVLAAAHTLRLVDAEGAAWAVKLYNAYDDLASAWQVAAAWPGPAAWAADPDTSAAAAFPQPAGGPGAPAPGLLHARPDGGGHQPGRVAG
jgi:hypothetical protein